MKKLLASASNLDELKKLITRFYYGTEIKLVCNADNSWQVHNSNGIITGVKVVIKRNRYRFVVSGD